MNEDTRIGLKVLSMCLQFPQESLGSELREALAELSLPVLKDPCKAFAGYVAATPLLAVQEEYTKAFDLTPSTSLNMSWHNCPDSRKRGAALVNLKRLYRAAGWEPAMNELPDYLPLMLEFMALGPDGASDLLRTQFANEVAVLAGRLSEAGSPYAGVLGAVAAAMETEQSGGRRHE